MPRGWGLGPVFALEWLTTSRRWQVYAARSAFVALLTALLAIPWILEGSHLRMTSLAEHARFGAALFQTLAAAQLALVIVAAPAATAGAICQDKSRGALASLLVTDLTAVEIVLGKLAARLIPVLGMIACTLPFLAILMLLGGTDPVQLTGATLVAVGVAVIGCSLALVLSVWGSRMHEVLVATEFLLAAWMLSVPLGSSIFYGFSKPWGFPAWILKNHPIWLTYVADLRGGFRSLDDHVAFLVRALLVTAGCVGLAAARLRVVAARQLAGEKPSWGKKRGEGKRSWWRRRWLPGPSLDRNPILWREWHRRRPTRWGRALGVGYAVVALAANLPCMIGVFRGNRDWMDVATMVVAVESVTGLLLLALAAATTLAEERARGSLDVLLTTPLSARAILWAKWWGVFRVVPLLAMLPTMVALTLVWRLERWYGPVLLAGAMLAYSAVLISLGVAAAVWIARPGRVVGLVLTVLVLACAAPVAIAILLSWNRNPASHGWVSLSPFWGTGYFSAVMGGRGEPGDAPYFEQCGWTLTWIAVNALLAVGLMEAAAATFDRCLGRVSGRRRPPAQEPHTPGKGPVGRPALKSARERRGSTT